MSDQLQMDLTETAPSSNEKPLRTPKAVKVEDSSDSAASNTVQSSEFVYTDDMINHHVDLFCKTQDSVLELIKSNKNLMINGKTLKEWSNYFSITIDTNPTYSNIVYSLSELNSKFSALNHNLDISLISRDLIVDRYNQAKAEAFIHFKELKISGKNPTNDYVLSKVERALEEVNQQRLFADYIVSFFEARKQQLVSTRRTLESIMQGYISESRGSKYFAERDNRDEY